MTDQTLLILAISGLGGLSLMALAYAFLGPSLTGSTRTDKRVGAITKGAKAEKDLSNVKEDSQRRRKAIQDTLKELEEKQKQQKQNRSLRTSIEQAGLDFTVRTFWTLSFAVGLLFGLVVSLTGVGPFAVLAATFIGLIGLPRWTLSYLCKKRQKKFIEEFANALDIIVRGVKSGLPLNECLKIISRECPDPVGSEFTTLVDAQKMGVSMERGLKQLFDRMPVAEVNFFQIVLVIQQSSGGNLSEALSNLSGVLRSRKAMRGKIQAMSSEAKASAMIIGSLPPAVMGMVYVSSPDYIKLLFTEPTGNIMLIGGALWMLCGVMVMRKMINFNF
jgi:tight adherence protein B